jgi:hypothetical protein
MRELLPPAPQGEKGADIMNSEEETRKLRSGLTVSLAEFRRDDEELSRILCKYADASGRLQFRIHGKIDRSDISDALWDDWDRGK